MMRSPRMQNSKLSSPVGFGMSLIIRNLFPNENTLFKKRNKILLIYRGDSSIQLWEFIVFLLDSRIVER